MDMPQKGRHKPSFSDSSRVSPHAETARHNLMAIFLLDRLFQAGYGYAREQAKGSLLDKAMQMPVHAEG
jgi:hypothetical protein